jgi:metal-responsive CopG/Arc/MetJ family transcriptional regulator
MRTTITLADDVAAAVDRVRHQRHLGLSEAVNELIRSGLVHEPSRERFAQKTHDLGAGIEYTNVAEAIETLDGPAAR